MGRFIFTLAVVLALAPTGSEGYQPQNPYVPNLQNPPSVTGTVVSMTDHSMTVNSDDGEKITFEVDSRSVMPTRLEEGQRVRVEFHLMDNGLYLTKRVVPMEPYEGMPPTATSSDESDHAMDQSHMTTTATTTTTDNEAEIHHGETVAASTTTGSTTTDDMNRTSEQSTAIGSDADRGNESEDLPATSSSRPLIEALGVLALLAGAGLWAVRRRRRAV